MNKVVKFMSLFFIFSSFLFSGVKFYGGVYEDVSQNFVSGVNVFLIGPNLSTTSTNPYFYNDRMINFEINNVPKFSSFMVKCSKQNYVNTYWGPFGVGDSEESMDSPIFTQNFYSSVFHGGTAPSHQSGKADIGGMVQDNQGNGVSGVVITAKYFDTNTNAGTIKYFGNDNLPGNYSSTQNNGIFCIYNVDPGRPILITGSKSGAKFTQYITIGYSDSVTLAGLQQINNYISISGNVIDESENKISGVNISIVGTSISASSSQDGSFTLSNVPPDSIIIGKMSKSGYKDTYMIGRTEDGNVSDAELIIISNTFYNQILNQIGKTHTSGKGDIAGSIGEIEGAVVKLYDYNGNPVNLSDKLFYANENGQFSQTLTSTSTNGVFIIINLDPGVYFIKGEKQGIEFPVNMTCVFANGLTIYETGMEFPTLYVWAGEEIQNLPPEIQRNATNVEMLSFNLWREGPENINVQSITFTAKGTGSISNSVSSAKLYYRPNWTDWQLIGTGNISGNKIIFNNLNLGVWESGDPAKFLSLVFDFNGNASPEQTFGVDILNSDIVAIGQNSQIPVQINGLPVYGKMTTISQVLPPQKPQNYLPENGAINIDGMNYKLWATPFNPGDGNPNFGASQWQIRRYDQEYQNPYWDSGENYNPTNIIDTPIKLDENMTYYWRVRYKNGDNVWSEWSDETWFTTGKTGQYYPPEKPQNQQPENGQTDIDPKNCKLIASQFSSNYPSDIHIASQWQIREQNGNYTNPVFDSGFDTGNKTSITVPSNILSFNKTYYWRVRYFGQQSGWSDWSDETYFKTLERQKGDINGDGQIDITDVIKCLRMAIGLDEVDLNADMDENGEIDITDVIKILRKAIGLD